MTTTETSTEIVLAEQKQEIHAKQLPRPLKKLRPARKQVKAGDVVKTETVQTGKEYSKRFIVSLLALSSAESEIDIWYNKWAGGDREDNYSKCVSSFSEPPQANQSL